MTTFPALRRFSSETLGEELETAINKARTERTYKSAEDLNFVARRAFMRITSNCVRNTTGDISYISGFSSQLQRSADALNEILRTERHLPLHSLQLIEAYAQNTDLRAQRLGALSDTTHASNSRWQNYYNLSGQQNRESEELKWAQRVDRHNVSPERYYGYPKDSGAISRALGRLENFVTNGR